MVYLGVLTWLHMVLYLKINLRKCELIPIDEVENIEMLVNVFNCKVGDFLVPIFIYH